MQLLLEVTDNITYENNLFNYKLDVESHCCQKTSKFDVFVDESRSKLPIFFWLVELHKKDLIYK